MWLWLWEDDLPGQPGIGIDQERSSTPTWKLKEVGESPGIVEPVYIDVDGARLSKLSKYMIVPSTTLAIVRGDALAAFRQLPETEVDFHAAVLVCKDGESRDFTIVRPKMDCVCTDVENSDINWSRPGEFYVRWKRLEFTPDCMGKISFAREKLNRRMIVSDDFKKVLQKIDPKGIAFTQANGSRHGYSPWA